MAQDDRGIVLWDVDKSTMLGGALWKATHVDLQPRDVEDFALVRAQTWSRHVYGGASLSYPP